jgi:predicted O-methyltransferase YrrM
MTFFQKLRLLLRSPIETAQLLKANVEGLDNLSRLLNEKLNAVIEGLNNQSCMLNEKLNAVIAGLNNQSRMLNLRLDELVKGSANQSGMLNEKLDALVAGLDNQSSLLNNKLGAVIAGLGNQPRALGTGPAPVSEGATTPSGPASGASPSATPRSAPMTDIVCGPASSETQPQTSFADAMRSMPLLIDDKTYNTSHPDYDANVVRNFPGRIFNAGAPSGNSVYPALKALAIPALKARASEVPDSVWAPLLAQAFDEAKAIPEAELVLQRRIWIEKYLAELGRKYQAHYVAGWVNLDDALFLYWLVRRLKPKTIVQCGVCNGLSSAFMMLALAKNGPEGRLHVIDLPPVFDPHDPAWTVRGKVYGVVIPEGKSSGWIVPDAYRNRFDVLNGDAKMLLPGLVDKLDSIDMFFHDSDHTYNHMMFEFKQAKRKLVAGGLIVADDISWNASLWDFADQNGVPSYNFKGTVGVAFF